MLPSRKFAWIVSPIIDNLDGMKTVKELPYFKKIFELQKTNLITVKIDNLRDKRIIFSGTELG